MSERKWGFITNGATFEALATTIIFFEDSKAALFGRRGKDGGQDAKSGDGKYVFQAKHHENGSSNAAIRDAKKEAEKIESYCNSLDPRHVHWKGVTHWRLVTNAMFNPTDKQKWDTEVIPLFRKLGLSADYWERENLNALLDRHPEIHRSFFENETRALLSVPEVRQRLPENELFLKRNALGDFCGRKEELNTIHNFLDEPQIFLVVHGAGGLGKTRLLIEAGETIASEGNWQVLWANVASMSTTSAWFESIIPERPTLLLVDDPSDDLLLRQLSEQIGGHSGRTSRWKIAIAVNSPKDPILRFLRDVRMKPRVRELAINALPKIDAEAMCRNLLSSSKSLTLHEDQQNDIARILSRQFDFYPIWLTLAIRLIEEHGDLTKIPPTAKDLANKYLNEIEDAQDDFPKQEVHTLLRWVSLVGTINREDDEVIEFLGKKMNINDTDEVKRRLNTFVSKQVLIARGAYNRLVEIKPDVLRDHILQEWLSINVNFGSIPIVLSSDAKKIINTITEAVITGRLNRIDQFILKSLVRTENILKLSGVNISFFGNFFAKISSEIPKLSANKRIDIIDNLYDMAFIYPLEITKISTIFRSRPALPEYVQDAFGITIIGQENILLTLSQFLKNAAIGAQDDPTCEAILREICILAENEANFDLQKQKSFIRGEPAIVSIRSVVEGGPQFLSNFDEVARKLSEEVLERLRLEPLTSGKSALLQSLVRSTLALKLYHVWYESERFYQRNVTIDPTHPRWLIRNKLIQQIKDLISNDTIPSESRIALWNIFIDAHREVNQLRKESHLNKICRDIIVDDLKWAQAIFFHNTETCRQELNFHEISTVRELWDWHCKYDSDSEIKDLSQILNKMYLSHSIVTEFGPLYKGDDWRFRQTQKIAKGIQLADSKTVQEIHDFIDRAIIFLGAEDRLDQLIDIAWSLGKQCPQREVVRNFTLCMLQQPLVSPRTNFGTAIAASWVLTARAGEHPELTVPLVLSLIDACGSDLQKTNLILQIYTRIPNTTDKLSIEDQAILLNQRQLFTDTGQIAEFTKMISFMIVSEWGFVRSILEEYLKLLPIEKKFLAHQGIINGLYQIILYTDTHSYLPEQLNYWLLDQILQIHDLDHLGVEAQHNLRELLNRIGLVPIFWLPQAMNTRKNLELKHKSLNIVRAVGNRDRFSKYVQPIKDSSMGDHEVWHTINLLLDFIYDNSSVGQKIHKILHDIDPQGIIVPQQVARRLEVISDIKYIRKFARIGGTYIVNCLAWRVIAKSAITATKQEKPFNIFSDLEGEGIKSWSGVFGEIPDVFISAVQIARTSLDTESEICLKSFWEWRIKSAETELRRQVEQAKEARGE